MGDEGFRGLGVCWGITGVNCSFKLSATSSNFLLEHVLGMELMQSSVHLCGGGLSKNYLPIFLRCFKV